jgi:hypothetical protein
VPASPAQGSGATSALAGSEFVRLLVAWGELPAALAGSLSASGAAYGERLSSWFTWTDAIALSGVLNRTADMPHPGLLTTAERLAAESQELARVQRVLRSHIRMEPDARKARSRPAMGTARPVPAGLPARLAAMVAEEDGFALHRQRYLSLQKVMENGVAPLRQRVREAVACTSPDLAQLAALDVLMEDVVGQRERALLARVPSLLERRYERLQSEVDTTELNPRFQRELQQLLEAELAFRLQPVEGLLDALRQAATP